MRNRYRPGVVGLPTQFMALVMLIGILALAGCSAEGTQGDVENSLSTTSGPTQKDSATPSSPVAKALQSDSTGRADGPQEATAPLPTPAAPPEPALSNDEIREIYGTDDPELAESMVGTLCNLNRVHLGELSEGVVTGPKIDDQMLRLAALSLSDDLGVWEGMAWQVPEATKEIEVAREVYSHWEYAIALVDAGNDQLAMTEFNTAEELIQGLPAGEVGGVEC